MGHSCIRHFRASYLLLSPPSSSVNWVERCGGLKGGLAIVATGFLVCANTSLLVVYLLQMTGTVSSENMDTTWVKTCFVAGDWPFIYRGLAEELEDG
jgi:hypothetical protein